MKKKNKIFNFKNAIFAFVNALFFFLGIWAYKNEKSRDFLHDSKTIFDFSLTNYNRGNKVNIDTLRINLSDSCYNIIKENRNNAVDWGHLKAEYKTEVPAKIVWKKDTLKTKMRLKGDYPDHWSGEKWSFRFNIKGNSSFNGMDKFSIQNPKTRKNLNEWYYLKQLESQGLIALRYQFVHVVINDVDKGVFAIEESFGKELLENNNKREAPILKFDESEWIAQILSKENQKFSQEDFFLRSKINVFKTKKTLKDSLQFSYYQKGKYLLNGLRNGTVSLEDAIDIKSAATLYAIGDLTGSYHGLRWHNQRFYFNPVLNKLEMIGFDSGSGVPIEDIYYNLWKYDMMTYEQGVSRWKSILFGNELFVEYYMQKLEEISDEEYLNSFNSKLNDELQDNLNIFYSEDAFYKFDLVVYKNNAKVIREKIKLYKENDSLINNHIHQTNFYFNKDENGKCFVKIINNSLKEVELIGLFSKEDQLIYNLSNDIVKGRETNEIGIIKNVPLLLTNNQIDSLFEKTKIRNGSLVYKDSYIKYRIIGSEKMYEGNLEVQDYVPGKSNELNIFDFCSVRGDTLELLNKINIIDQDLVIPSDYTLLLNKGTTIDLIHGAQLISFGQIISNGEKDKKVLVTSTDSSGNVLVMMVEKTSFLEWTDFSNLSSSRSSSAYSCSGGVNFYESNVNMINVRILNSKSEDGLNIIRSTFNLTGLIFENIKSDAFDSDFCKGKIDNSIFVKIGNDALDFSGSYVEINNITINDVGDKAISAGEKSKIYGSFVKVVRAELGLVSKDNSLLWLNHVDISNVSVALLAFQKKREYGPSYLYVNNSKIESYIELFLLENKSSLSYNKTKLVPNSSSVVDKLYGNQYGKSSK